MSALDSVNDLLLSGGGKTAKFDNIGDTVKGTIISAETGQQTDIKTGAPKFYDDGKPMPQIVVTLQTDLRDPDVDDDDGIRRLFVKGQMMAAVREALRQAQAKLDIGGTLAVQYKEDEPPKQRSFNPKKIYVAQYRPPAPSTDSANDLLGAGEPAQQTHPEPVAASSGVAASDLI